MKLGLLLTSFPILAFVVMNVAARPMLLQGRGIRVHLLHQPRGMRPGSFDQQALASLADVFLKTNLLDLLGELANKVPETEPEETRRLVYRLHLTYVYLNRAATDLRTELEKLTEDFGTKIEPEPGKSDFRAMIQQLCYTHDRSNRASVILQAIRTEEVLKQLVGISNGAHGRGFKFISERASEFLLKLIGLCNIFISGYHDMVTDPFAHVVFATSIDHGPQARPL